MFLRIKKIKGNEYCYLVNNVWTKKGARQEVKSYLGRVYAFDCDGLDFFEHYGSEDVSKYLKKMKKKQIISDLAAWELARAGFKEKEKVLVNEGIAFDLKKLTLVKDGREVVAKINEGFLCGFTLKRILGFKKSGEIEQDSVELAKAFVEAGISVPEEIFIGFFGKL